MSSSREQPSISQNSARDRRAARRRTLRETNNNTETNVNTSTSNTGRAQRRHTMFEFTTAGDQNSLPPPPPAQTQSRTQRSNIASRRGTAYVHTDQSTQQYASQDETYSGSHRRQNTAVPSRVQRTAPASIGAAIRDFARKSVGNIYSGLQQMATAPPQKPRRNPPTGTISPLPGTPYSASREFGAQSTSSRRTQHAQSQRNLGSTHAESTQYRDLHNTAFIEQSSPRTPLTVHRRKAPPPASKVDDLGSEISELDGAQNNRMSSAPYENGQPIYPTRFNTFNTESAFATENHRDQATTENFPGPDTAENFPSPPKRRQTRQRHAVRRNLALQPDAMSQHSTHASNDEQSHHASHARTSYAQPTSSVVHEQAPRELPSWIFPDFKRHTVLNAAPSDAMKFSKFEITAKNEEGAKQLDKWIQDIKDVAKIRGMENEDVIFAMAKRLLRGTIKDKFEQRYLGDRTISDLQKFIFREISPRDPADYYRRKFMSIKRKPNQKVDPFNEKFLTLKKAYEMALEVTNPR